VVIAEASVKIRSPTRDTIDVSRLRDAFVPSFFHPRE
jgi:hypothetical protein